MQSENTAELAAALAVAQSQMGAAVYNKQNPHFKNRYADLAAVLDAIRGPLSDNGLSVTQTTEIREGGFVLVTTLHHATGQWIASEYPLPLAAKPQELGSAMTYARRYSLSAIACIAADDDDDAEAAREGGQTSSTPKAKGSPIKPVPASAPIDPETGEVSPHTITAATPMAWGQSFVAAIQTARDLTELDAWLKCNEGGLSTLETAAAKVHARVISRVDEKAASFKQQAAA